MFSGPASGLFTSPNPFSAVPAGSLRVADNVLFTSPGIVEPRRGFDLLSGGDFGGTLADTIAFYGEAILLAFDFTRVSLRLQGGEFRLFIQTFEPNSANRMRFEPSAQSMFFNPKDGIRVWDGVGSPAISTVDAFTGIKFDFDNGLFDLDAGEVVTDSTSGATGASLVDFSSNATGTIYMLSSTVTGLFNDNDSISGAPTFTATVNGATTAVLLALAADIATWPAGYFVRGNTSNAVAVILSNTVVGAGTYRALDVDVLTGAFIDESVSLTASAPLQPQFAGNPQGLSVSAVPDSADGWMDPDTAVAYVFTVCAKDAFGRVTEGPPSGRFTLRNQISAPIGNMLRAGTTVSVTTSLPHYLGPGDVVALTPGEADFPAGAKTVVLVLSDTTFTYTEAGAAVGNSVAQSFEITRSAVVTCRFPPGNTFLPNGGATQDNFLRVYRTEMTVTASDVPSPDLFQCYESAYLTAAQVSVGLLVFNDIAPEALVIPTNELGGGPPLYTNRNTGEGQKAANFRPPICEDIAYWQDRMWYANTTEKHAAFLTIIGVGAPDGIQVGDTITIVPTNPFQSTVTFTAVAQPDAPGQWTVFDDADPGYNIQRTAQSLCELINTSVTSVVYAFYVSDELGQPGRIYLQAREYISFGEVNGFSVFSSRATAWNPQLPTEVSPDFGPLVSANNRHAARVFFSKASTFTTGPRPEAVPLLNFVDAGADNDPILRIFGMNYRLLVFKSSGVYFIPSGEPFGFQKLSDRVLIAPDSISRLDDVVYFLSDQGFAMVTDSGVGPASTAIDNTLLALGGPLSLDDLRERTFGCSYRSNKQYLCWVPERDDVDVVSADNEQAFCFSTQARGWTRYAFGARCAAVDPGTDQLVVAPAPGSALWLERKALTDADYADVGGAAIDTEVIFNDLTEGEPATMKMAQQCSFLFKENGISQVTASFASEVNPQRIEVSLDTSGWGGFSWGEVPWGGFVQTVRRVQPLPLQAANCCQLSVGFSTSQAGKKYAFLGIDVVSGGDTVANRG